MVKINKTNPTAQILLFYVNNGEMKFDNPVQRGFVWKRQTKSLLIHSMICGFPIPPIYASKIKKVYDVFDGKQRCQAISDYLNNKYSLSHLPEIVIGKTTYDISGMKFENLPQEIQEILLDYNLDLHYYNNLSQDLIKEMFVRLNSGKPLSTTEMTKAQTKSISELQSLSTHSLFELMMNETKINSSQNVGYAMQSYIVLFSEDKCLLTTKIKHLLKNQDISAQEVEVLNNIFNYYYRVFEELNKAKGINKRLLSVLKRKTHFVSLVPIVQYCCDNNINEQVFINWLNYFFNSDLTKTTINNIYNENIINGTNRASMVEKRINAAKEDFVAFVKNIS